MNDQIRDVVTGNLFLGSSPIYRRDAEPAPEMIELRGSCWIFSNATIGENASILSTPIGETLPRLGAGPVGTIEPVHSSLQKAENFRGPLHSFTVHTIDADLLNSGDLNAALAACRFEITINNKTVAMFDGCALPLKCDIDVASTDCLDVIVTLRRKLADDALLRLRLNGQIRS